MIRLTPTRRPTGTLRIDRSNPLTTGLIDVFVPGCTVNPISGLVLTATGTGSFVGPASSGLSQRSNGTHFAAQSAAPAGIRVDELTMLAFTAPANTTSTTRSIYGFGSTAGSNPIAFIGQGGSAGTVYFFVRSDSGTAQNPNVTPSSAWATNAPNVIVGVRSQSANFHAFYQNGNQVASTTATTIGTTTLNATAVGGLRRNTDGLGYDGATSICLAWNRALSPAEIRRISENPWQIFEGFTLYVKTADGGYSLTANGGTLTLTGGSATLTKSSALTAQGGTLSLAGGNATLAKASSLTAQGGTLSLTGGNATLAKASALTAQGGALTLTGGDATLAHETPGAYSLTALGGTLNLSGGDAVLTYTSLNVPQSGGSSGAGFRVRRSREFNEFIEGLFQKKTRKQTLKAVVAQAVNEEKLQQGIAFVAEAFERKEVQRDTALRAELELVETQLQRKLQELEEEEYAVVSLLL